MKKLIVLGVAGLIAALPMAGAFAASGTPVYSNDNKPPPFLTGLVLWWLLQADYKPLHPAPKAPAKAHH